MEEEQPNVIRKPTLIYVVTLQEWPANDGHPEGYSEVIEYYWMNVKC